MYFLQYQKCLSISFPVITARDYHKFKEKKTIDLQLYLPIIYHLFDCFQLLFFQNSQIVSSLNKLYHNDLKNYVHGFRHFISVLYEKPRISAICKCSFLILQISVDLPLSYNLSAFINLTRSELFFLTFFAAFIIL